MSDVICRVCDRVHFNRETHCEKCHWPLVHIHDPGAYGHDLIVECMKGMAGRERVEKHYKGPESTCRRRAMMVPGFVRVVAIRPLDEKTYINAYGRVRV